MFGGIDGGAQCFLLRGRGGDGIFGLLNSLLAISYSCTRGALCRLEILYQRLGYMRLVCLR